MLNESTRYSGNSLPYQFSLGSIGCNPTVAQRGFLLESPVGFENVFNEVATGFVNPTMSCTHVRESVYRPGGAESRIE